MDKIPLLDLKAQYKSLKDDIDSAIKSISERQSFILGEEVKILEHDVAGFCGAKYGVGLNSGTDALILTLRAFGIKEGDEVITTPFTFMATAESIALLGGKPVFIDIDPKTYNINPELIKKKITKKTKAIIPVHLYGLCADMNPILEIAKEYGLKVLEDCAQAIGSAYLGKKAGSMGDAGAISFFPSKNLGAFGDGGMVVTNDKNLAEEIQMLRQHGSKERYIHEVIGYNSRLDNIQAAVLNIKLKRLSGWIDKRIENAKFLNNELKKFPLVLPYIPEGYKHTYHLYIVRSRQSEELIKSLNGKGIDSRAYYPIPLHMQKCFSYLKYRKGDLPESEKAAKEVLNIPAYPELTMEQKEYIAGVINDFFKTT